MGEYQEAVAERNELRAVVDAAREFDAAWSAWQGKIERGENVSSTDDESRRRAASIAALLGAVRQLDGSADMGGTDQRSEPERSHRHGRAAPSPADGSELADAQGNATKVGTDSTEGAPHESDGDEQTSAHGAPDPPNGGPVPPSTPAPRPDIGGGDDS